MNLQIKPQDVLHWFYAINQIPRASGNEDGLVAFMKQFAKDRHLFFHTDTAKNVIIKKPATPGYEHRPAIILQGHMDMVAEKTPTSTHDFFKDPIEMYLDGEWLCAKDTTLGADNGIAIAYQLALLDRNDISHGPLECLMTAREEVDMDGAIRLDASPLTGKYLLNLDSEEETDFTVGCAGGATMQFTKTYAPQKPTYTMAYQLQIHGLKGGHSGINIIEQRANANILLIRSLRYLSSIMPFEVAEIQGGSKPNVIPSNASATLLTQEESFSLLEESITHLSNVFSKEFSQSDHITISLKHVPLPTESLSKEALEDIYDALYLLPNGVIRMSEHVAGLVETSMNIAMIHVTPKKLTITTSLRSSSVSNLTFLQEKHQVLAKKCHMHLELLAPYPAWEYEGGSHLERVCSRVYETIFHRKPRIIGIHAGLECGVLKKHLPNTQMISFGPDIVDVHSPKERCHMPSVSRVYDFLIAFLKEIE